MLIRATLLFQISSFFEVCYQNVFRSFALPITKLLFLMRDLFHFQLAEQFVIPLRQTIIFFVKTVYIVCVNVGGFLPNIKVNNDTFVFSNVFALIIAISSRASV